MLLLAKVFRYFQHQFIYQHAAAKWACSLLFPLWAPAGISEIGTEWAAAQFAATRAHSPTGRGSAGSHCCLQARLSGDIITSPSGGRGITILLWQQR